ncbi:hypothetical protein, partial [Micrococcus luteus]|uniref:hypothetical protein n=1 Tax=Micrococcus luteus TaxID=1270 RepID=UPI000AA46EDE
GREVRDLEDDILDPTLLGEDGVRADAQGALLAAVTARRTGRMPGSGPPARGLATRTEQPRPRPRHPGIPATPALSNVTEGLSRVRKSP